MKRFNEGDTGKAVCEACGQIVDTTFCYRDVPFSDSPGVVRDILIAACDRCDSIVSIPAQSTPAIKATREIAVKPLEVNLPVSYVEILDLAAYRIDPMATAEFRKRLLTYYIHRHASLDANPDSIKPIHETGAHRLTRISAGRKRRLSFKITPRLDAEINAIVATTNLKKTEIVKGLILKIDRDIVQPDEPENLAELRHLAAVVAG